VISVGLDPEMRQMLQRSCWHLPMEFWRSGEPIPQEVRRKAVAALSDALSGQYADRGVRFVPSETGRLLAATPDDLEAVGDVELGGTARGRVNDDPLDERSGDAPSAVKAEGSPA
jgi:hypothetical protein